MASKAREIPAVTRPNSGSSGMLRVAVMSFSQNAITPPGAPGAEVPQGGGRVGQVHQDQPADYRIDRFVQVERVNRGLREMHCGQALFGGAGACQRDHLGCGVDTENGSRWADQPGGDE